MTTSATSSTELIDDLAASLATVVPVDFGFAWKPETGALIIISHIKLDGAAISLPEQGRDSVSPFTIALGSFPKGRKLKLDWRLRVVNDLLGIAAFVRVDGGTTWKSIAEKVPASHLSVWEGSATYDV